MQGPEVLIPLTIFAGGFAMIFGIVYLRTRENMAMIEKNMNPKRYANLPAPFRSLKLGLLLLGAGAGLLVAYTIDHNTLAPHQPEPIYFSLIAIGGGLGLIGSYFMERKAWEANREYEEKQRVSQSQLKD
ncbi:MAG TPA: DUF6249 domain-containing protein [Flavisolibacter sp.]|jgi:O-antigen ligase|nr:DUF6249 domain-containing protein [Flavisolibacter sp.]